jgi:tyrosyl-tRNA synthetase
MGRNLQREYGQESQIAVITPLLEGTDGVQKMSKSLGNYIGINEPPQEIFGKVMSISDDLMWRYYELLTDVTIQEIASLRNASESGERNPRDIKADLAKMIVTDFHSAADAKVSEEEFNRMFRNKEMPQEVEDWWVPYASYKLPRLLAEMPFLASSIADARRLISQGAVRVNGERVTDVNFVVDLRSLDQVVLLQVGKRRFVRVQGAIGESLYDPNRQTPDASR